MKAHVKLFLAMASFVAAMCIIFGILTSFIVQKAADAAVESTRGDELEALAEPLIRFYEDHNRSWEGVGQLRLGGTGGAKERQTSLLLVSPRNQVLLSQGKNTDARLIRRLGVRKPLRSNGSTVAVLYEYDPDIAMLSKLRYGIPISVLTLLIPSAVLFIGLSLLVAWGLSKRMTAPLHQLMPAIERLGKGDYGVQASVRTQDEYGQVGRAFNKMSRLLRDAEENRRNLVADVAHELRTPITIVRGKLDLLQHSGERIAPESLLPLQDELIRLTRLIDDLHQLSLAEARKLHMERRPTNMCELLQRIVTRIAPDADRKGIRITLACGAEAPMLDADPNRLTQVFLNLVMNAVRYTRQGGSIAVSVREDPDPEGGPGGVRVEVADDGPGIAPRHLPHLFDRFYRADEARVRVGGGAGLGLAIAKGFVTAHDGTIEVESELGQGTTFVVRLPGPTERAAPNPSI